MRMTRIRMVLLVIAVLPGQAWAWGRIGHRVAARMAEERLSPRAKAGIEELLGPGVLLRDVAVWADDQEEIAGTGQWHYVNVPVSESRYSARYCPPKGCVVSKVEEFRKLLQDRSAGKAQRQLALKFLIHFIADLHQPMHVGDDSDRGGNLLQVRFFNEGSNLHRVWDYQIMERHTKNESVWMWDLDFTANPRMVAEWSQGVAEDWATETLDVAKKVRRLPGSLSIVKPGSRIGDEYCKMALTIIQRQLAKASIRTAWVLNRIFDNP